MNKPEIYFHVGLPKTASTFLQRQVFPKFGDIQFVKKHQFKKHDKIIQKTNTEKILLSTELNLGKPYVDKKVINFAEKHPEAKTILVLRRQDKWLQSKYKYHIRKNGGLDFNDFFNLNDTGKVKVNELHFMSKIEFLEHYFSNPPLIIFQEELVAAPGKVFNMLANEMNASVEKNISTKKIKPAYSHKQLKSLLRFNQKHPYKPLSKKHPKILRLTQKKLRQLMVHSVAYYAKFFPGQKNEEGNELIPQEKLREIKNYYAKDWGNVLNYAGKSRDLYI